jgi:coenzyme F420-reducing hydrogenase delta subunit
MVNASAATCIAPDATSEAAAVAVFICANCARPAQAPPQGGRLRPVVPDFAWPVPVQEILVPCTGRIQPEHVLKAFESGADAVCAVGCEEGNCHYVEGSKRCARRVEYVRSVLRQIGMDPARLLFFTLPGTAAEDLAMSLGKPAPEHHKDVGSLIAAIRDSVLQTVTSLPPSPLRQPMPELTDTYEEMDASNDQVEQ